jgi:hypothetical protein
MSKGPKYPKNSLGGVSNTIKNTVGIIADKSSTLGDSNNPPRLKRRKQG